MNQVSDETLYKCIAAVLSGSQANKRKFIESVDLQICLKNYDPQVNKRFTGTVQLPYAPSLKHSVCIIGDEKHCDEAKAKNIYFLSIKDLKSLGKRKSSQLAKNYDAFLVSESLVEQIPQPICQRLRRAGKNPIHLSDQDDMGAKITVLRSTIRFQIKTANSLSVSVGNVAMSEHKLAENIHLAVNFLVSELQDHWQNIRSLHIKSTMGPPHVIFNDTLSTNPQTSA